MSAFLRNIPNILTGLRLASAPILAFLLVHHEFRAALAVFVFAGLTDAADGWLAKRFHLLSRFGRYLDPIADKLLMLVCVLALAFLGAIPAWLTIIVIGRDALIVLGIAVAKLFELPLRVAPLYIGKVSTAVQVGYIALMLIVLAGEFAWPELAFGAALVTGAVTVASFFAYLQLWLRALARSRSRAA